MQSSTPYKVCPQCHEPAHMQSGQCVRCGRMFRTTAPPPIQQTQVFGVPPQIQAPYNGYGPPPTPQRPPGIAVYPGSHSPMIAVLLSLICVICFGQFYNKQIIKGMVMLLFVLVLGFFTGGLSLFLTWPLALIDAYKIADRLNRGETITEWQWF